MPLGDLNTYSIGIIVIEKRKLKKYVFSLNYNYFDPGIGIS